VRGNQIVEHSSDNQTVLSSSWKLGAAAEHLIDGSEKCNCWLSFEFRLFALNFYWLIVGEGTA